VDKFNIDGDYNFKKEGETVSVYISDIPNLLTIELTILYTNKDGNLKKYDVIIKLPIKFEIR